MSTPAIQWYPGHIAKAQRQLREQLQRVDVVLEVLDARIPLASRHPELGEWLGHRSRLLVLNKADRIPPATVKAWCQWFQSQGISVYPTNGQSGQGISRMRDAALELGASVNQRRQQRGMQPRAIRAAVVGFPNVGKSAILNRLVGRRVASSAAKPGVTRQLRWVRLGSDLDLLDSPGIIPPSLTDQLAATKLAICDDIGQAAYTPELVAASFFEMVLADHPAACHTLEQRYGLEQWGLPGSLLLDQLATERYRGNRERAAIQVLNDYRKGLLGTIPLEHPPATDPVDSSPPDPVSNAQQGSDGFPDY